jgi:hypothetical protein
MGVTEAPWNVAMIDTFISAQLPDLATDPIGYDVVSSFLIHGPCGTLRTYLTCTSEGKCSKFYPKKFCEDITILENGFVRYARRNNGLVATKDGVVIE